MTKFGALYDILGKSVSIFLLTILLLSFPFSDSVRAQDGGSSSLPIVINGRTLPFLAVPGEAQGDYLVSLREIAEETGLTIGWLEETKTVRLKSHNTIAYLQIDSDLVLVNSDQYQLSEPLKLINGRLMVPVSFLNDVFGYQAVVAEGRLEFSIPTEKITGIDYKLQDGRPTISVRTTGVPKFESYLLTNPDRIVVDFHDTTLDLNGNFVEASKELDTTAISGIRWSQFNSSIARVVIDLKKSVGFEVVPEPTGKGLTIALYKQVKAVSFQRIFGRAQLQITGTSQLDYSVSYLKNPERMVIDLEKATLATGVQELDLDDPLVQRIRINQFLPHIVRIVLELNYPAGCIATPSSGQDFLLFELVKKITGVEVSANQGQEEFLIKGAGIEEYAVQYFPELAQILIDIPGAMLSTDQPRLAFTKGPVSDIKLLQVDPTAVQIQLGLRGYLGHNVQRSEEGLRVRVNSSPLAGRRVVVDPGHGGEDPGAIGRTGLMEKDVVLGVALELQRILKEQGAEVIMVRESDCYVPLLDRARIGNTSGTDAFVSIHVNSSINTKASGTETYYYYSDPEGQELATLIQREMIAALDLNNRAPRPNRDFVVLTETRVPAVLTEVAFISNRDEEKLLSQTGFRLKAAQAIARGISSYFAGPTWRYQDLLVPKNQEGSPSEAGGVQDSSEEEDKEEKAEPPPKEFSWESLEVTPEKPGEGIVDKVKVIEIK